MAAARGGRPPRALLRGFRAGGYLSSCVAQGAFPGAAWAIWRAGAGGACGATGRRIVTGPDLPADIHTWFDLASLTKPLATTLIALRLAARGQLDLDAPVGEALPELRGRAVGAATMTDLLTHRSGLPAWQPLYLTCRTIEQAVVAIGAVPLAAQRRVVYSDLGFVLAGAAIERLAGRGLAKLFADEVTRPLGVRDVRFAPPASMQRRTAATELGNQHERGMIGMRANRYRGFRKSLIWGEVHDHNCHTLGGATGHAGLFGSAPGVLTIARAVLGEPRDFLPPALRRRLFRDETAGQGGHRTLGFRLATDPGAAAGPALSRRAIGHSGFTGTSVWIDPAKQAILVLLTNRMHPTRSSADLDAVRRAFHVAALSR